MTKDTEVVFQISINRMEKWELGRRLKNGLASYMLILMEDGQ
jgi:DNA-binding transcriptional regulator YiaG